MFQLIIIPILVGLITQIIKLMADGIPNNFSWRHLINDYGGMPSAHTAYASALTTVVALREGLDSAAFAISLILMIIVIRDAIGFRREIGRNAVLTNQIAKEVFKNKKVEYLQERIGHTLPQILVGLIIGFGLSAVLFFFIYSI